MKTKPHNLKLLAAWACFVVVIIYSSYYQNNQQEKIIQLQEIISHQQERIITLRELTEVQTTRLDARGKWMIDLTASLKEWLDDRWIVSDEQQTWDQLFDSNPGLAIPTGFIPYNREHNPITLPNPPY